VVVVLDIKHVDQMVPTLYSQLLHLQVAVVVVLGIKQHYLVFQEVLAVVAEQP
jgi:hypothetical protein